MVVNGVWYPSDNGNNGKELCSEVVDYIIKAPLEELKDLSLGDITEYFSISKMYLIRCFKEHMKTTPGRFIFREKMQRAAILVLNNNSTIRSISDILGFCSADYFIKVFKKHFGMPPAQYRICRRGQQLELQNSTKTKKDKKKRPSPGAPENN